MTEFWFDSVGIDLAEDETLDDASAATPAKQPQSSGPAEARPAAEATVQVEWKKPQASSRGVRTPLYFDIETAPDYDRMHLFGLDPLPPVPDEADLASMPDPTAVIGDTVEKIKAVLRSYVCPAVWLDKLHAAETAGKARSGVFDAIREARNVRQNALEAHEDRRKLLSTTPEFCRIVALGYAIGNDPPLSLVVGQDGATEKLLLQKFWSLVCSHLPLIGFNCLHFDLPVIFVRSALLKVPSTRLIDTKPWGGDVVDPYAIRFPRGGGDKDGRPRKLKALAPLYGIEVPAGDCDGSQVEELLHSDPVKLGEYVRSDVAVVRALHRSLVGYFWA